MWQYLTWVGIPEKDLLFFVDNPCPPDILGTDYYATSERFLDNNISCYPSYMHGSNGRHTYVDVEAIRIKLDERHGPSVLLKECWDRYKIPIAIREVHIHGNPDDQVRWFHHLWNTCLTLKGNGVDIRAVTAWAMFGSYGWSKLLTEYPGEYERGVFDLTCGEPATTSYTEYLQSLSQNPYFQHPAVYEPGWWQLENRFLMSK